MSENNPVESREAMVKALFWRFSIAIPLGTLITYLWIGTIWKSVSLMLFMNFLFTFIHYVYELTWPKIWGKLQYLFGGQ